MSYDYVLLTPFYKRNIEGFVFQTYVLCLFLQILQANVCHAYHIMKKNGIPEERIVLMMYDDVAYDPK